MKKLILFLVSTLLLSVNFGGYTVLADEPIYARIESEEIYFYEKAEATSPLFELPKSYFVLLTKNENDLFYQAEYQDLIGYVKKDDVTPVEGTPQKAYFESSVSLKYFDNLGLYSSPKNESPIATIPPESSATYYGKMSGYEAISGEGRIWYYCKYTDGETDRRGYLYQYFCNMDVSFTENETDALLPTFQGKLFPNSTSYSGLSDVAKTFIILGITIPVALILYLLIKPTITSTQNSQPNTKKKKKRSDYFEFDENDLT